MAMEKMKKNISYIKVFRIIIFLVLQDLVWMDSRFLKDR